jgi:hypothetical protein
MVPTFEKLNVINPIAFDFFVKSSRKIEFQTDTPVTFSNNLNTEN